MLEEFLQVPGSSEEETRQDQILAEASAQAAEWAERLAFLNEESETAWFSDAIRENTDAVHYLNTQIRDIGALLLQGFKSAAGASVASFESHRVDARRRLRPKRKIAQNPLAREQSSQLSVAREPMIETRHSPGRSARACSIATAVSARAQD
jgi:hypothetical protein